MDFIIAQGQATSLASQNDPKNPNHYFLLQLTEDSARLFEGRDTSLTQQAFYQSPFASVSQNETTPSNGQRLFGYRSDKRRLILRFFKQINQDLRRWLPHHDIPLVLTTNDGLAPLYRSVSGHKTLLVADTMVDESFSLDQLTRHARQLIEDHGNRLKALKRFLRDPIDPA